MAVTEPQPASDLLPEQPTPHDHAWRRRDEHRYGCDLCSAVWDLESWPLAGTV